MIWVSAVVAGLSVLAVFGAAGVMVWRLPQAMCDATAMGKSLPGLVTLGAVIAGSVSTYALFSLSGAAS